MCSAKRLADGSRHLVLLAFVHILMMSLSFIATSVAEPVAAAAVAGGPAATSDYKLSSVQDLFKATPSQVTYTYASNESNSNHVAMWSD